MNIFLKAKQRQISKSLSQSYKGEEKLPFVELTSTESGAGKTHLLYAIVTTAILPRHINNVLLSGKNSAVVVIDADLRFDISRLAENAISYLLQHLNGRRKTPGSRQDQCRRITFSDANKVVGNALKHVHVIRPQSVEELSESLLTLPGYLLSGKDHSSLDRPLHSILLDSANAFYWEIRATDHEDSSKNQYKEVAQMILKIQANFGCVIVATTFSYGQTAHNSSQTAGTVLSRSSLLNSWLRLPTLRLILQCDSFRSLEDSLCVSRHSSAKSLGNRDTEATSARVWLDESQSDDWNDQIVESLSGIQGGTAFSFSIIENGVAFNNGM